MRNPQGSDAAVPRVASPVAGIESADIFRELVASAPDAMIVLDATGRIALVNEQAESLFGYARHELVGERLEMLLPERFRSRHVQHRSAYSVEPHARPMGAGLDLFALHKSGREIPVEISLSPLETASGTLVASAIRDVSDRRALERELQAANAALDARLEGSELRYHHIFHNAAVGIARLALDGTFLDVNERACEIVGFDRDAMMSMTFHDNIHPDDLETALELADRLVRGEIDQYQIEKRYIRRDGSVVWVHHTRSVVRNASGEPESLVVVLEDITARKRGEERLQLLARASEVLGSTLEFEEALQQVASLVVPALADWCAVDLVRPNSRHLQLVGIAHTDPGKIPWAREMRAEFPVDLDAPRGVASVLHTGKAVLASVITDEGLAAFASDPAHLERMRRLEPRSAIVAPLVARGTAFGTLSLVRTSHDVPYDEHDLRFAEDFARRAAIAVDNARLFRRTQELNATLEARVLARSRQVRQLASEIPLAEARERGRVARLLHDDLQQQLHVLQFQLHELRDHVRSGAQEAFERTFGEIAENLRLGAATTRNLTSELSPVVLQNEDLADALRWLGERFLDQHRLEVVVSAPDAFPFAHESLRALLFSLVREFLFNVVKHAGVDRAEVRLQCSEDDLTIAVSDDGEGFDASRAGSGADSATGFGLKSAQERLQLFGGTLRVDSAEGAGTTVTVVLPTNAIAGTGEDGG